MTLPNVGEGDPHVVAHNAERGALNALLDLTSTGRLSDSNLRILVAALAAPRNPIDLAVGTPANDWDQANLTGLWIDRGTAANAPGPGWWLGNTVADPVGDNGDSWNFILQELREINSTDYAGSTTVARRRMFYPTTGWGAWVTIVDT